ncbi:hypothetical protein B296_00050352 [Ensete ventricosum]|uniref:Uncharacterized protein n=1 Tax=Ensete ventricosum TaxID=4639 RepID=A0A426XEG2_ENSVE|nr:hypothetical protein B296_00050352 [Ensete ventricosum]
MKSYSERRNKRRYCHFHKEYDHDTEECRDLQYQIEDLIQCGHPRRYVRDQSSLPDSRPPRDSSPRPKGPVEKQIYVIFEGPASGGDSSLARKAYARSEIEKRLTPDEDLDITFKSGGEEYPCHDDALVISIQIGIDRQRFRHSSIYFDRVHRGLRLSCGGDHDSCRVWRRIEVENSYGVIHVVNFPSAYNAIIGCLTLNRLKVVVSTYHRLLKFSTRAGVGEVRSDPRESKRCYLTTMTLSKKPKV